MKVVYTAQSIKSLEESLFFLIEERKVPIQKVIEIKDRLLDQTDSLSLSPYKGQKEEYLRHLNEDHRRLVEGHFKIIYKIEKEIIYIIDFFDSRQDPMSMKG
ncbi:MAG: type II toxin-antitoxin system RelE/ParE family toxin [Bacteroidota bacterium]